MQAYHYPQFPTEASRVYVALYNDLKNAHELRARLIKAATMSGPEGDPEREAVNFAFIDARLICSLLHLQTAIYHAILAQTQETLRTKSVHSEILWMLNPTNNITEALRRYGVSDDTKSLFVVRISGPIEDVEAKVMSVVQASLVPVSSLNDITDWTAVKKYYKLNNEPSVRNIVGDIEAERFTINNIVISSVATKTIA